MGEVALFDGLFDWAVSTASFVSIDIGREFFAVCGRALCVVFFSSLSLLRSFSLSFSLLNNFAKKPFFSFLSFLTYWGSKGSDFD